jgi:gliding motility-associated-like protein
MRKQVGIWVLFMLLALSYRLTAQESINFRIEVKHVNQDLAYSNVVEVERPFTLFVPNAFTPNGDGLNDVFQVRSESYSYYHMVVYDRWGNLVFESMNAELGWDGRYQGKPMPIGVYSYQVVMRAMDGTEWNKAGQVTIASND